jgi:glycosyltransferase involved in cell wall biosynthesis
VRVVHLETGTHLYGGALQVLLLARGLDRRGVESVLVVPRGSALEAEAGRRGLPVRPLPMAGELDLLFVARLRRLLADERPDLIHLHSRRGADTLGALAARWARVPVVLSRRVDNPEPSWAVGPKYRLYDRVVTISQAIRGVLVSQGVPAEKIRCVPSALDPEPWQRPCDREAFRALLSLPADGPLVGMAAQFIPRKGHQLLLEAVPLLLGRHPGVRFLLFGTGPLRGTVADRVREMGLQASVLLPGFRDDLPSLLPCLDVLVHPASLEGLGVILLQASAAGVPVVAAAVGGIPEAVEDGHNGLLVPPGDAVALAAAVASLLDDPERARAMGERGRTRVRSRFSVDGMVEGNLAVYRELLGARG